MFKHFATAFRLLKLAKLKALENRAPYKKRRDAKFTAVAPLSSFSCLKSLIGLYAQLLQLILFLKCFAKNTSEDS